MAAEDRTTQDASESPPGPAPEPVQNAPTRRPAEAQRAAMRRWTANNLRHIHYEQQLRKQRGYKPPWL